MSQDVITVGSTIRIPLLYRECTSYSQRPKVLTAEEKKTRKIDRLARSLLDQGLPNDIYSLIDSNETAKDLWDALERQMHGFEYGEQDRKAAILYEYETFKANEGEQSFDTYLRYLQVINDLKKCGYKKDNCELNYKFLNNLQQEWKQYATLMRQTKNLMEINIDALYNILKQNQRDVNDALGYKKKAVVILVAEKTNSANKKQEFVKLNDKKEDKKPDEKKRDMSKVKCYNCRKERHFAKDCKKAKVKDYNYNKTKMLLAKKDSDEQVLLAEDQAWMESSSDSDQEINVNIVFMAQIEKVFSESDECSSSAKETIAEVAYYTSKSKSEFEFETSEYYDNSTNYGLVVNNDDDQEIFHDASESASKNFIENHIDSQKDYDKSEVNHNDYEEKEHLVDKLIRKFNHKIAKCQKRVEKANQQSKDFKNQNKDLQEKYDVLINQVNTFKEQNNEFNEQIKVLNEKNADLLDQMKVLKDQLQVKHVMIDTHIECHEKYAKLKEEKKIIIDLEDEVVSLLEKEKENLETIESLKSKGIESSENEISKSENQSENDCLEVGKECDKVENPKNVESKLKRKRRKRKSSKQNDKQVNNDVSGANSDFVHFSNLDTFSSVGRPKNGGVIWKKKGSSNTSNVDLSYLSHLKLNKDVKRYSRKDLLSCNNSHLGETRSAYVCNDAINVSYDSKMYDLLDDNNFFIFDDESDRISPVSKMPFRKKPHDSLNVHSKHNLNKSLPRSVHKCLPKLQPLAEPIAKWFPIIVQIYLWIIDSRCSKHMTGNHALLTNFVEKFLGTVRFGNNEFAAIAGYEDVVIGSMTIKKVYYVEGLGRNLFRVGQFCDKGLEVAFRKSTCFFRNEDGVDLLTGDRSSNLYTITLNEVASNSSTYLLAKASSSQSCLWHQRLFHLNFATINNLVKNNLVQGLPKMKFEKDHLCYTCAQGKIHRKHHKSKTAFALNKPLYLLHMDLCGSMRVQSINGKRYVLVVVDNYSRYTWVFFFHSKDEISEVIISFIKKTQVNLQLHV
nr:ribonuclease H-like domain-containing protein [Tanacetum cinerariifolium]